MKFYLSLFVGILMIISASAQDVIKLEGADKKILAYIKAFSESSEQSTYISWRYEGGERVILFIDKFTKAGSSDDGFMFKFIASSTLGLFYKIENHSTGRNSPEDPKIGEDVIGIPADKIEILKQYLQSKGLYFSEQWCIIVSPTGKDRGAEKGFRIYSRTSMSEVNSEMITYVITELYGFNIAGCRMKPLSDEAVAGFKEVIIKPKYFGAGNLASLDHKR